MRVAALAASASALLPLPTPLAGRSLRSPRVPLSPGRTAGRRSAQVDSTIELDGCENMPYDKPLRRKLRAARAWLPKRWRARPGTLIIVRHGESEWNFNKTFTGWQDPDLSERGYREVRDDGVAPSPPRALAPLSAHATSPSPPYVTLGLRAARPREPAAACRSSTRRACCSSAVTRSTSRTRRG